MPPHTVASEVMASRMRVYANQALMSGKPCTPTALATAWRLASSCSVELGLSKCLDRNCQMPPVSVTPIGRRAMDRTRANGHSTQNVALTTDRKRPAQQAHLRRQRQALLQRPALLQAVPVQRLSHHRVVNSLAGICRAACSAAKTTTTHSSIAAQAAHPTCVRYVRALLSKYSYYHFFKTCPW